MSGNDKQIRREFIYQVKAKNKLGADVSLTSLSNKIGIKLKDLQDGLRSVVDFEKKVSTIKIVCYSDNTIDYVLLPESNTRRIKQLHLQYQKELLSLEEFETCLLSLARERVSPNHFNDDQKILSQFKGTLKGF